MVRKSWFTLLVVGSLSGCNWYYNTLPSPDDLMKLVPWFDHMIKSPAVSPYQRSDVPRLTPPGTVPITGGEADWNTGNLTGPIPLYGFDSLVGSRQVNPTDPARTLARGDTLYATFCATCHGDLGDGKGPVGVRLGAMSLVTDRAKSFTDGYLYSIVRYGRAGMPLYGDKIFRQHDRWAVVNYLRKLQGLTAPAPAPAAEGTVK